MSKIIAKSVIFVTGTFLGANCWDEWKVYFESEGYTCLAPNWPHKYDTPEELRNRHPDREIALNNLDNLTDYFATIIQSLPEKPILIGHSLGGLIVQRLIQRGLAATGVAVHSFPPNGVHLFRFSFLKAAWKGMSLFTSIRKTYMISFKRWKYTINNGMTCDEQRESYYRYAIPESKRVIRDIFMCKAKINFNDHHVPLLFTSGGNDRIVPASINYNNYQKYNTDNAITDYKNFENHNHLVFGQSEWSEEAHFILQWIHEIK